MNHPAPRFLRGVAATGAALTASVALGAAPAAADEPVAVFVGDGLEVVIEAAGPDGRELRGRLAYLGKRYPFTATTREDFGRSEGTFRVGGAPFAFSLLPTGDADTLQLVTASVDQSKEVTYDLRRRAASNAGTADAAPVPAAARTTEAAPDTDATPGHGDRHDHASPAPVGLSLKERFGGGWEITAVDPGSRAELAGFAPGDLITAAREAGGADVPLTDRAAVTAALRQPGTYLTAARLGRADHTVVLYPASSSDPPEVAAPAAAVPAEPATSEKPAEPETDRPASATDTSPPAASAETAPPAAPVAAAPRAAERAPAPTAVFALGPATITDTQVTGLTSHDLLLPAGWSLDAEVLWTPAVDAAFVNVNARATSPGGGHQVTWLPDGGFTDAADADAAYGEVVDGKVHFPRFDSAASFISRAVLPRFRPDATGIQVLAEDETAGLADAWERHHETFLTAQKKHASAVHAKRAGAAAASPTTAQVSAPQVRLRYEENGSTYDEAFTLVALVLTTPTASGPAHDWFVFDVSALRAPAGALDNATPGLRSVAESLRPTQRWQAVIEAMTPELTKAQPPLSAPQAAELAAPRLAELDALVTAHTRGWSALRAANAARVEAFAAASPDLTIAQTADGKSRRLLPTGSGLRALSSSTGEIVLTQDPPAADAARPDGPWETLE